MRQIFVGCRRDEKRRDFQVNSIAVTNVIFSAQQIQLRIWLPKNLTVEKYNRTVILQCGKPIPK